MGEEGNGIDFIYAKTFEGKNAKINWRFHSFIHERHKKQYMSRPKTHSKGVTVISHLKPEGLKYNLTQTVIL